MTATEHGPPNWRPLEAAIPLDDCPAWMWMSRVHHDDRVIEQYKHRETRRYLNLDQDGQAWRIRYPADHSGVPSVEKWWSVDEALKWVLS